MHGMPRSSPLRHPRGRLPARVYWFRRIAVLGTAALLVGGIVHLVAGGEDEAPVSQARLAGAPSTVEPTPTALGPHAIQQSPAGRKAKRKGRAAGPSSSAVPVRPVLAQPDGPCAPSDISVEPRVEDARAGRTVPIDLLLTATRPACTFTVSAATVAVKVTSGSDFIWSSQDCPRAVPRTSVVVRSAQPTTVRVAWSGRRSDGSCGVTNAWARPGYYHALGAVIGSEPGDVQFALSVPPRPVVTKTARPRPEGRGADTGTKTSGKKSATTSGTVRGKESACGGDNAASSCD